MKKQILTRKDVQKALLKQLNKALGLVVFLVALIAISIFLIISYFNGTSTNVDLAHIMFTSPLITLLFTAVVIYIYFMDLYYIKTDKFIIREEELDHKEVELVHSYKRYRNENALYFPCGRAAVDKEVYEYSDIGDRFYVVTFKSKFWSKRIPRLAYHTKYYVINDN